MIKVPLSISLLVTISLNAMIKPSSIYDAEAWKKYITYGLSIFSNKESICDSNESNIENSDELKTRQLRKRKTPDDYSIFQCGNCSFQTENHRQLTAHLKTEHSHERLICITCDNSYQTHFSLYKHQRDHKNDAQNYICLINGCKYSTNTEKNLIIHTKRHHSGKQYACKFCTNIYTLSDSYNRHMRLKHKAKPAEPERPG